MELIREPLGIMGIYTFEIRDALTGRLKRTIVERNLITTVGKTAFAAQMGGQATKDIGDDVYIACGSNVAAPALGDTQLGTETVRILAQSKAFSANVASIAAFFA